jgi:hypothetical protein
MEADMADDDRISGKRASGSDKGERPDEKGGDQARQAQQWGGGTKASKGSVSQTDKQNENSSAKR